MGQLDCLAGLGKMVGEENNDLLPEVSVLVAYVMLPNLGVNVMWYCGTVRYRSIQEYIMLMGFLNTIYTMCTYKYIYTFLNLT